MKTIFILLGLVLVTPVSAQLDPTAAQCLQQVQFNATPPADCTTPPSTALATDSSMTPDGCQNIFASLGLTGDFDVADDGPIVALLGQDSVRCKLANPQDQLRIAQCLSIRAARIALNNTGKPERRSREDRDNRERRDNREESDGENNNERNDGNREQAQQRDSCGSPSMGTFSLDYPACKSFFVWYQALMAGEQGLSAFNTYEQGQTNSQVQRDMTRSIATGETQTVGFDAARQTYGAAASREDRIMAFQASKGAAILAQLQSFPDASNVVGKCGGTACCQLFGTLPTGQKAAFFPNAALKSQMTAEVARAMGSAVAAKLRADAARAQANMAQQAKQQLLDNTAGGDTGLITFCQTNPADPRCAPSAGVIGGFNPGSFGSSFTGANLGTDGLDFAAGAETTDVGVGATDDSQPTPVEGIGGVNTDVAGAKDTFDAPSGGPAKVGAATGGGGGGGAAANASAPGLSKDPGVQEDKKQADLKITNAGASYNGAAYSGGAWRPGAGKKEGVAENPFSALFGKAADRGPAATEIDAQASDLFTKISNRYGEVQKRKGLLEME